MSNRESRWVRDLIEHGWEPVIPTVRLSEAITGRPRRMTTGIDAIVAAHAADAREAVLFVTDPSGLRRLLADCPWVRDDKP